MASLSTRYMGLPLKSPVVVGACSLSGKIDNIRRIEAAGAGALVIKSIFEEQILHDIKDFDDMLSKGSESFAESLNFFPTVQHAGAREHLMWVEKSRKAVDMPLVGSINAVTPGNWVEYARQLVETGVDALELNVYAVEANLDRTSHEIEQQLYDTFQAVKSVSRIPVSVKLSPFYSSIGNVVKELEARGAASVVLFNRFLQPDIDIDTESSKCEMTMSSPQEMRLPLRWVALLHGNVSIDIAANTGVSDSADIVKYLLAGATVVQVASVLYKQGIAVISDLNAGIEAWMDRKGYSSIAGFRGNVSVKDRRQNAYAFERAQYLDFLLSTQKSNA